jgi:hypothetical protein
MDWPALLEALKPYGFRESPVLCFSAHRPQDTVRVEWWPRSKPQVEVLRSRVSGEMDMPPLFSGSPEEVVRWFREREGVTT